MAGLIDTSVLISIERAMGLPEDFVPEIADQAAAVAAITISELLVGVYQANTAERRTRRESFIEYVLEGVPVLTFDVRVARTHARLSDQMRRAGITTGAHDLQIAATAVAHNLEIVTENVREFERVPGLIVRPFQL
jgi:predicted nucleic acid-binding protein